MIQAATARGYAGDTAIDDVNLDNTACANSSTVQQAHSTFSQYLIFVSPAKHSGTKGSLCLASVCACVCVCAYVR